MGSMRSRPRWGGSSVVLRARRHALARSPVYERRRRESRCDMLRTISSVRRGARMKPKRTVHDVRGLDDIGRVNRLYAVLSKVNEAIVRVHEPQDLYEAACRIAVEDGHFILAWIGFVEPDTQRIRWAAKYGRDDGYLDTLSLSLDGDVPEGRGPTGVALREGRPFINNDTETNPVMRPWRDEQM